MSRIIIGVIAGFVIGILAFFGGNYLLKTYFSDYFLTPEMKENLTKPSLNLVSDLVPQKLEAQVHANYYLITWHTAKPVVGYIVLTKQNVIFSQIQNKLNNTQEVLFTKIDDTPSTEHSVKLPIKQGFNYFYILEQQGAWVIPYGQKIYKDKGASDPYILNK